MGRYRVENAFGPLVYIQLNVAYSVVFALSRVSARDFEQVLSTYGQACASLAARKKARTRRAVKEQKQHPQKVMPGDSCTGSVSSPASTDAIG